LYADTLDDIETGRSDKRRILGTEHNFSGTWNSILGAQQNPKAFNVDAVGVNPHHQDWTQFVAYLRTGQCAASSTNDDLGYFPVYFSEFATGWVIDGGGSWRMMHSIADMELCKQYMNLYDVRLGFWHNVLEILADKGSGYHDGSDNWNSDYAQRLYEGYVKPGYDLHLDRDAEILVVFDPPSIACGSTSDQASSHAHITRSLLQGGYLCDVWRSFRFREESDSFGTQLANKYKLIIIPNWFIMEGEGSNDTLNYNELGILDNYLDNGGKIMVFDGSGTFTFNETTGEIKPRVAADILYEGESTVNFDTAEEWTININDDFGYLSENDKYVCEKSGDYNNENSDTNNILHYSKMSNSGFTTLGELNNNSDSLITHYTCGSPSESTIYGNVMFCGIKIRPYLLYSKGDNDNYQDHFFKRLMHTVARWAQVDKYSDNDALVFYNSGFEDDTSGWTLGSTFNGEADASIKSDHMGYGEKCVELKYEEGGLYDYDDIIPPSPIDVEAYVSTNFSNISSNVEEGKQYVIYFDAKVERYVCPGPKYEDDDGIYHDSYDDGLYLEYDDYYFKNDDDEDDIYNRHFDEYKHEETSIPRNGPYLGVYMSTDGGANYELVWVSDLIAEDKNLVYENDICQGGYASGDWHRYELPFSCPYDIEEQDCILKFAVSGELQLLREREDMLDVDNDNNTEDIIWIDADRKAEFANLTVLIDNVGSYNELVTADASGTGGLGYCINRGHEHQLNIAYYTGEEISEYRAYYDIDRSILVYLSYQLEQEYEVNLRLYCDDYEHEARHAQLYAELLCNEWNEDEVESLINNTTTQSYTIVDSTGYIDIDITDIIEEWVSSPDTYHGICLRANDGTAVTVNTREVWDETKRPRIVISY
jgi:hypothetical protein